MNLTSARKKIYSGEIMIALEKNARQFAEKISCLWISTTILDVFVHSSAIMSIVKSFASLGHKASLIAIRSSSKLQAENSKEFVTSIPLRFIPVITPLLFTLIMLLFLPIFIIHSGSQFIIFDPEVHMLSCFSSLLICKLKKVKLVLDIRTIPVETAGIHGFLRKFVFAASILIAKKTFDGITVITPSMKEKICADFNLNTDKVGVWTSGVSDDLFNSSCYTLESAKLKAKYGLNKNFVIFYHGIFTETRGLIEVVEAMAILKHKRPDVSFFLLGKGPITPLLRTLILDKDLQDTVIIHKPVSYENVPKFISICDVGIVPLPDHPYWRFQSPLKLLEYLSMGKAVILTDIPAHRSIIGGEDCGIYVSSIDPVEMASAIEYAYNNKENLSEWGKSGRRIIKQTYTWEKVASCLENYLLSIAEKN